VLANVARTRGLKSELNGLRWQLRRLGRFGKLVGSSPPMQEVYNLIARVAPTNATVLVVGESGTGKELVAETLHALSRRADKPLFAVNCGAVSPNLIESELFGHEKGSFTGADKRHIGYFERAAGGTLLLDEITEMSPELQVKLLRVLESGHFLRVGGNDPLESDVRILAATNRDPIEAVRAAQLREDLYYRLNVFTINLPALRERGERHPAARPAFPRRPELRRGDAEALVDEGIGGARRASVARQRARAAQCGAPGVHPRRPRDRRGRAPGVRAAPQRKGRADRARTTARSRCRSAARSRRSRSG
jgi:DNA-binding NtrC family response regulator